VELANLAGDTLDKVTTAECGIQRIRSSPLVGVLAPAALRAVLW
jgi:hypothetical protein